MRNLVRDLFNSRLSRRGFMTAMVSAGYTVAAAKSALQSVAPFVPGTEVAPTLTRPFTGTGGELLTEQLIEAGARYMFIANGSGLGALCDALVTRPQIQLIQALHEGHAVSIADGYAKATGRPAFGMFSRVGLPNSSSNMYNSMKDRTPVVLFSDHADTTAEGRDGHEDIDDWLEPVKQYTKWRWVVHEAARIPEWVRNATKVASVLPCGPTYVRIPRNVLYQENVRATVFSGKAFEIPMELRPDSKEVERAARLLWEASSPALIVGPEVTHTHARASLVKLAELLALPVLQARSADADFPNFHPLYVGEQRGGLRYPGKADCILNFGARAPTGRDLGRDGAVIHASVDPEAIGRNTALSVALLGHLDQVARELIEAVKSIASPSQIEARTAARRAECTKFTTDTHKVRLDMARQASGQPVPWYRVMFELNELAEPDAVIVSELGVDGCVLNFFPFADDAKLKIGRTEGMALGWGVGAVAGVKLALPNRQVIAIQGDGGFLFGQTDALWTMSRYDIPVLIVILNNKSYEATRWRIMARGTAAGEAGRDYISYLGDPDVGFTHLAAAYNIAGEIVQNTDQLRSAIQRGFRTLQDGRPYLLDIQTKPVGIGAEVSWYPKFSVAKQRERAV